MVGDINGFELSGDGKKILVRKDQSLFVIDAAAAPADLAKKGVDLSAWALSVTPRDEWRQMYVESWRLMRDYFYDPAMHGVDWKGMLEKYRPLADRVATRAELSDVMALYARAGRTGVLDVRAPARTGSVWFEDGELVHAACGAHTGATALFEVLCWNEGRFAFRSAPAPARSLSGSLPELLARADAVP